MADTSKYWRRSLSPTKALRYPGYFTRLVGINVSNSRPASFTHRLSSGSSFASSFKSFKRA
eukprot:3785654-Rhodomonas_salina.3